MPPLEAVLVFAYVAPVALLAWVVVAASPRPRPLLILLLVTLPLFYALHHDLLQRLPGWPSDAELPETFQLLDHRIVEPDGRSGRPGEILIWAQAPGSPAPRVHRLPYDESLHRRLSEAAQRQADGRPQRGRQSSTTENGTGPAGDRAGGPGGRLRFEDDTGHRPPPKTMNPSGETEATGPVAREAPRP
jgi:hypothetical protein